jgi:hypothetical protein
MQILDFPKLESPFVRKEINGEFLVTPEIDPDYKWVFEDESVTCQEKLDGTNVSIVIEHGKIVRVFNRTNDMDLWSDCPVINAVRTSYNRGYCKFTDGQYFGEAIGEKIQSNRYKIQGNLWLPYSTYFVKHLTYKSWGKYPKDFETISNWFKEIIPLYAMSKGDKDGFVEGVVFHHPDGRMAKLRKDMFEWFKGARHKD